MDSRFSESANDTSNYIQQLESRIKLLEDEKQLLLTKIKLGNNNSPLGGLDCRWNSNMVKICKYYYARRRVNRKIAIIDGKLLFRNIIRDRRE